MGFSVEDRILVKNLYSTTGYGAVRLINEFPAKGWKKNTLNDFVEHLKQTGSITRKCGNGRPRTVRTDTNIDAVDKLVLSLKQSDWARMCEKAHHFEHLLNVQTLRTSLSVTIATITLTKFK